MGRQNRYIFALDGAAVQFLQQRPDLAAAWCQTGTNDVIASYIYQHYRDDISKVLQAKFPKELTSHSTVEIETRLLSCSDRMQRFGVRQQEYLTQIFVWDLMIGQAFEDLPQYAPVLKILQSGKREPMKFDLVRNLMRVLAPNLELTNE